MTVPTTCPICGEPVEIITSDSGTENLTCVNPNCQGKILNKLDHYCSDKGMDIKGLSKATLEKLYNWGWINSFKDLYLLKEKKNAWANKPGFGAASVLKVLTAIEERKKNTLEAFIAAIGIPTIGRSVAKEICKNIESYEDFRNKIKENFDWSIYDGFGYITSNFINNFDYADADEAYPFLELSNSKEDKGNINKVVCITGSLQHFKNRAELQKKIELAGGRVVGSMSSKVDYLINNDLNSTSSKNLIAKKNNIPIISESEAIKIFDL